MHLSDALRFSFLLSCCAAGALQAKALDTYLRKKYQKQGIYHTPELQSKKFKTVGHTGALFAHHSACCCVRACHDADA